MARTPPQTTSPRRSPRRAFRARPLRPARSALAVAVIVGLWLPRDSHAERSCEEWSAEATAVEGRVEVRRFAQPGWAVLATGERVCSGDAVRSERSSRAFITLLDGTTLRLDENSAMAMPEPASGDGSLIELLRGVLHVISRDPRRLLFITPYANAGLEGTEFDIRVDETARVTEVVVLEGSVLMTTPMGALSVASDHIAVAKEGQGPTSRAYAEPIELMRWASHFPAVLDEPLPGADQEPVPAQSADADFYARRAAARLATARIAAVEEDLAGALRLDPRNATALSLSALLALARADRDTARTLVTEALAAEPASVVARLVLSHLEQSSANLRAAESAAREAADLAPDNPLVLTRLAEIALARGDTSTAIASATRARELAPAQSAPLVVLGFASLRAFDTEAAKVAFARAVELAPNAPLARLGAGLAAIQSGDLTTGREQLERAVILDPALPPTRSYMAKVYDAQNRSDLTVSQLDLAKEFDPVDPTPWLYSSLHSLRANRPVEALRDWRAAAQKNGDRPVFRSWLALDEDLATRSAGIGRVHNELGFGRLALNDAWRAIDDDPTNFAAHRLLAEGYSTEPRHEIARVSELHVAQLLQPANMAPIKPQLAQQNLFIAQRAGPSHASFDELGSPVAANGLKLRASAVTGGRGVEGNDVAVAGLHDGMSYSFGYYRFATDGFRDNNDLEQSVANAFLQFRPSQDTNLQLELRSARMEHGDPRTSFNRDVYAPLVRFDEDADSLRFGAKHDVSSRHTLLGSMILQDSRSTGRDIFTALGDQQARSIDVQDIFHSDDMTIQSGVVAAQSDEIIEITAFGQPVLSAEDTNRQIGLYSYLTFNPTPALTVTAGASFDAMEIGPTHEDAANPKVGLTWRPNARTTVRAAAFETLYNGLTTSSLNAQPQLEPVQVAGFTQFLLGGRGDQSTVRGVAVDHELSPDLLVGWQAETRNTDRLGTTVDGSQNSLQINLRERAQQAYLYWMPLEQLTFNARYERSRYRSEPMDFLGYSHVKTERLPLELRYFAPVGLTVGVRASHVQQEGLFSAPAPPTSAPGDPLPLEPGEDSFWVVDAFLGYRLPNRRGLLSLNADNLLDEAFRFQDIDPSNPSLFPERLISLRFTLAFD